MLYLCANEAAMERKAGVLLGVSGYWHRVERVCVGEERGGKKAFLEGGTRLRSVLI